MCALCVRSTYTSSTLTAAHGRYSLKFIAKSEEEEENTAASRIATRRWTRYTHQISFCDVAQIKSALAVRIDWFRLNVSRFRIMRCTEWCGLRFKWMDHSIVIYEIWHYTHDDDVRHFIIFHARYYQSECHSAAYNLLPVNCAIGEALVERREKSHLRMNGPK